MQTTEEQLVKGLTNTQISQHEMLKNVHKRMRGLHVQVAVFLVFSFIFHDAVLILIKALYLSFLLFEFRRL